MIWLRGCSYQAITRHTVPTRVRQPDYDFELGGQRHENIVWYYSEPFPESAEIKGLISFYNEKIDEIRISNGEA